MRADLPDRFTPEGQRYYPNGSLASQLLGLLMDEGLAGWRVLKKYLQGKGYLLFSEAWAGRFA